MLGYGNENTHFTIELTYNYGVKSYKLGNEFGGVTIKSKAVIENAKSKKYPMEKFGDGSFLLQAPDGFKFFILNENAASDEDPIKYIIYNVTNLEKTLGFWCKILNMKNVKQSEDAAFLSYNDGRFCIKFQQIKDPIDRAEAFGRIAFAVPYESQPKIDELIKKNNQTILTPLVSLDTPGKATVSSLFLTQNKNVRLILVIFRCES